ncbi:MAG: prepilin-type N-terminal cleavage/methylation domain-containing protein [Nitrospirales bacterium]|nr:prepilin-type N-terminal cleavage/methylation domain-containing protein [Nitrospirales bacterium]
MNKKGQEGFSLLELIIVVVIVAVISAVAVSSISKFIKQYKFDSYAANMEYLVKLGKIKALELTSNVGVCVDTAARQLSIRDIGTSRSAGICSGSPLQGASNMTVAESYITVAGTGASFDPRGLAIQSGYTCFSYNGRYARVCISRSSVRTDSGAGGCSSCSS